MNRNNVITRVYRVGRNRFLVIRIIQRANAVSPNGNALASNQAAVRIFRARRNP